MLPVAIAVMCVAVLPGMWLGSKHLLQDKPPRRLGLVGAFHGIAGAACVALTWLALSAPGPAPHHGAGAFGWTAFYMLAAALAGGVAILTYYVRGRTVSAVVVALHATAGVAGAVTLAAYFTLPSSYGR